MGGSPERALEAAGRSGRVNGLTRRPAGRKARAGVAGRRLGRLASKGGQRARGARGGAPARGGAVGAGGGGPPECGGPSAVRHPLARACVAPRLNSRATAFKTPRAPAACSERHSRFGSVGSGYLRRALDSPPPFSRAPAHLGAISRLSGRSPGRFAQGCLSPPPAACSGPHSRFGSVRTGAAPRAPSGAVQRALALGGPRAPPRFPAERPKRSRSKAASAAGRRVLGAPFAIRLGQNGLLAAGSRLPPSVCPRARPSGSDYPALAEGAFSSLLPRLPCGARWTASREPCCSAGAHVCGSALESRRRGGRCAGLARRGRPFCARAPLAAGGFSRRGRRWLCMGGNSDVAELGEAFRDGGGARQGRFRPPPRNEGFEQAGWEAWTGWM